MEATIKRSTTAEARWYVLKAKYSTLSYRESLGRAGLEYFLPTRYVVQDIGGRRVRVERPLIYNFIFVRGVIFDVKAFCRENSNISLLYRRRFREEALNNEAGLLIVVSDNDMAMFAKTVGEYKEEVPFVKPSEVELQKGDLVRILDGPFAGVEGTLMSQQGKDGGRVLVNISNVIAVPTLEIRPEYLQILSFASGGKHLYKKFDSFMPRARKALCNHLGGKIDTKDVSALAVFERRYCELRTYTVNTRLKLQVCLMVCYTCLKGDGGRERCVAAIEEMLPEVNSSTYKAFAFVYLYACTSEEKYRHAAEKEIAGWGVVGENEKSKAEIAADFSQFVTLLSR